MEWLKISIALLSLFTGAILIFHGVSPSPSNLFDVGTILLGVSLVLGYPALLGEKFEEWMWESPPRVFAPFLIAFGFAVVLASSENAYSLSTKMIMSSTGFCMIGAGIGLLLKR